MCYGSPAKSLELARSRMSAEQWAKFEREFDDFCVVQGLPDKKGRPRSRLMWAKWAFFQGQASRAVYSYHLPCMTDLDPECARVVDECFFDLLSDVAPNDREVTDAYFEKIGRAMMSDEQALASLERWMGRGK